MKLKKMYQSGIGHRIAEIEDTFGNVHSIQLSVLDYFILERLVDIEALLIREKQK